MNSDRIFRQNPVYKRIHKQIDKGIKKYQRPVSPEALTMREWHEHLQQELTDGLVYNEILLMKIEEVTKTIKWAKRALENGHKNVADKYITHALDVLEEKDDKN